MKLQIKNVYGEVLYEGEALSLSELLKNAIKDHINLSRANLSRANLSGADLSGANLSRANLSGADLSGANLSWADLSRANLSGANLSRANLSRANLSGANLSGANLSRANLSRANLSGANLSRAKELKQLDSLEWFRKNFKKTKNGVIVYKAFDLHYAHPDHWKIEPGAVLTENCNPNPTDDCGCGINFATREWIKNETCGKTITVWRCLIRWSWLPGVVIPWGTDGKARCPKLQLLEIVK